MSRGKGCGGYNEAGIYTRVKRKLEWIFQHISRDNCPVVEVQEEIQAEENAELEEEEEEEEEEGEEDANQVLGEYEAY